MRHSTKKTILVICGVALLALAGCGGGHSGESNASSDLSSAQKQYRADNVYVAKTCGISKVGAMIVISNAAGLDRVSQEAFGPRLFKLMARFALGVREQPETFCPPLRADWKKYR